MQIASVTRVTFCCDAMLVLDATWSGRVGRMGDGASTYYFLALPGRLVYIEDGGHGLRCFVCPGLR